jgi:signal peptidase I
MKRAIGLAIIILVCVIGYLSAQGMMPFAPAFGSGMEPAVKSGSLIVARPVKTAEIAAGDIVVFKVPPSAREYYGYPPVLAQRVIEVNQDLSGISYRVQGDDAAGEPLSLRPRDIKGELGGQVPYLGFPLMIFRSGALTIFVLILVFLFGLYLYSREINAVAGRRFKAFVSPMAEENRRVDDVLAGRIEATEQALNSFAGAMREYAQHLASHTSAIKGLSEASQALKEGAAEQNRVLSQMAATLARQKKEREVARIEEVVYHFRERTREIMRIKEALEKETHVQAVKDRENTLILMKISAPRGCVVKPKALLERPHIFPAYTKVAE